MYKPVDPDATARDLARETRRLTAVVERLVERDYIYGRPWRHLSYSFLNGLFTVLGSTLGVALFIWLLRQLGYLPFLGDIFQKIQGSIGK